MVEYPSIKRIYRGDIKVLGKKGKRSQKSKFYRQDMPI